MSASSESIAATAALAAPAACLLCGGQRQVPHFRVRGAAAPSASAAETYRITHSERRLVHAIVRCADCGMVSLPLHAAPPTKDFHARNRTRNLLLPTGQPGPPD